MRILVTGSRDWTDAEKMARELLGHTPEKNVTLVHGGARGADLMARGLATAFGWTVEGYPAIWQKCAPDCPPGHQRRGSRGPFYCPTAGHRRNQKMVDLGADFVLAFFKEGAANTGTRDCVQRAMDAGLTVIRVFG